MPQILLNTDEQTLTRGLGPRRPCGPARCRLPGCQCPASAHPWGAAVQRRSPALSPAGMASRPRPAPAAARPPACLGHRAGRARGWGVFPHAPEALAVPRCSSGGRGAGQGGGSRDQALQWDPAPSAPPQSQVTLEEGPCRVRGAPRSRSAPCPGPPQQHHSAPHGERRTLLFMYLLLQTCHNTN